MELYVKSSIDETLQPVLFYPAKTERRPLLVGLHTWSKARDNQIKAMLPYAEKYDFNLLLPEFRGPNLEKNEKALDACGSILAKTDIIDACDMIKKEYDIDEENIFLLGASGGGHMALLMAGFAPEYFKAIGAFVPISDLGLWREQNPNYTKHVDACTNGADQSELDYRSPITYIDTIAKSNIKIFHGKRDNSVPVTQSIDFFNEMMKRHPDSKVYLDIFDGGHEMSMETAMTWILSQYNEVLNSTVTG